MKISLKDTKKKISIQSIQSALLNLNNESILLFEFEESEDFIGQQEVKQVVELCKSIKETNSIAPKEIIISLPKSFKFFDPILITAIYFIKQLFVNTNIIIDFKKRGEYIYRLTQLSASAYLANDFQTIFQCKGENMELALDPEYNFDEKKTNRKDTIKYVTSQSFLPFIIINKQKYSFYFENNLGILLKAFWERIEKNDYTPNKNFLKSDYKYEQKNLYKLIKDDITKQKREIFKNEYYLFFYFKILSRLLILRNIFLNKKSIAFKIERNKKKYDESCINIIEKLNDKPVFFMLLFYILVMNLYSEIKPSHKESQSEKLIQKLKDIFNYCEEVFIELREIAKNIKEHSTYKRGAITLRIFKPSIIKKLKNENSERIDFWKRYFSQTHNAMCYIDISIVDDGREGIISRSIKNLKPLENKFSEIKKLIKNDILMLKNIKNEDEQIKLFEYFFNTDKISLEHQNYKAAASYGLLIFTSLIKLNKGCFYVSTFSKNQNKTIGTIITDNYSDKFAGGIFPHGTYYNVVIPIFENHQTEIKKRSVSVFETLDSSSIYEQLFNFHLYNLEAKFTNKRIVTVSLTPIGVEDKYEQIVRWKNQIESAVLEYADSIVVPVIDFKNSNLNDASQLLRIIALLQLKKEYRGIIVYNTPQSMVKDLITICKILDKGGLPFWSNEHYVLFYFKEVDEEISFKEKIYNQILLAGSSKSEFYFINKKNSINHRISLSVLDGIEDNGKGREILHKVQSNPLFSINGHLLPFDLLLNDEGITLFENNVFTELNRSIK